MGNRQYYLKLEHEAMILLLGAFNENASLEDYYRAIYDSDIFALQNFLGITTREEMEEFYQILNSMDTVFLGNDELFEKYSNELNLNITRREVGLGYRAKILQKFLISLVEYKKCHADFSLEEQLLFLNVGKNLIVKNIAYYTSDELLQSESAQNIIFMEQRYVEFLSDYYQLDVSKVRELEESISPILEDLSLFYKEHRMTSRTKNLFKKYPFLELISYESEWEDEFGYFMWKNDYTLELKMDAPVL